MVSATPVLFHCCGAISNSDLFLFTGLLAKSDLGLSVIVNSNRSIWNNIKNTMHAAIYIFKVLSEVSPPYLCDSLELSVPENSHSLERIFIPFVKLILFYYYMLLYHSTTPIGQVL